MIELDELGEMAWVPLALLAAVMAWRSRSAVLASLAGGGRLQAWRDGAASAPGSWVLVQAGSALQWMWSIRRNGGPPSGNQSFDSYRDDALRKLKEEQREFRAFLAQLHQSRDRSEFDAFMAERAR
jgi:hypothetical protein